MHRESMETMLKVRHAIEPSEDYNDAALGQIGLLLHSTCAARSKLGIAHGRTQEIVEKLVGAATMQVEVRRTILDVHATFAELGREVMPDVMQGDHGCPGQHQVVRGAANLHVVGGDAVAA